MIFTAAAQPARSRRPWLPDRAAACRRQRRPPAPYASRHQPPWGNVNKLRPGGEHGAPGFKAEADGRERSSSAAPADLGSAWEDLKGVLLYNYYNWRTDTWSDLQLFMFLNAVLLGLGAWIEGAVIRQMDTAVPQQPTDGSAPVWWADFYAVVSWVLGQDLPSPQEAGLASQVYATLTVILGLACFALVLALIEQVVLEVLESNVKRGSAVYERGHLVVCSFAESAYDLSQLIRILGQICAANEGKEKGCVVVVLTQDREKLEMESIFREALLPAARGNTRFVFRQGSPLDPAALRMVAATHARSIIICGDGARSSLDSDAQCLRAAVVLDEMVDADLEAGRITTPPSIVFQVQNPYTMTTVSYACSQRIFPVPAFSIQARRIARIIRNPIVSIISDQLYDYRSNAHGAIHEVPQQLVGLRFTDLFPYFPNAIMAGVISADGANIQLNPSSDRVLQQGDSLVMLRPGPVGECPAAVPLAAPPTVDLGQWDPSCFEMRSQDEVPLGTTICGSLDAAAPRQLTDYIFTNGSTMGSTDESSGDEGAGLARLQGQQHGRVFVLPLQYGSSFFEASDLLICGWGSSTFMWSLLQELDHGAQALPPCASVTLMHEHEMPEGLESACKCNARGIKHLNLRHVKADPRNMLDLRNAIDITKFSAVVVLADILWCGREGSPSTDLNSHRAISQTEMLRMDAAALLVQLNIRALLQERGHPDINIIVQKLTMVGSTRFEDSTKAPLGLPVNPASFVGKLLTQAAFESRLLQPYMLMGVSTDLLVQDSSALAGPGEQLSFLQLQARAASVQQVLLGYYRIPSSGGKPLEVVINPQGLEARTKMVVFNSGDSRCKLVVLAPMSSIRKARSSSNSHTASTSEEEGAPTKACSLSPPQ